MAGLSSHPLRDSALLALYGQLLAELDHTTGPEHAEDLRARIATVEHAMERLSRKLRQRRIRRNDTLRALDEQLAAEIKNATHREQIQQLRISRSILHTRTRRRRLRQ